MKVFITGISKGLGKSLCEGLKGDNEVYGLSRNKVSDINEHVEIDLSKEEDVKKLENFNEDIDLLILNAGVLGGLRPQEETSTKELKEIFDINVFSQKTILDILLEKNKVKQVICISSGAANKCRYGWGNYALSKATLKMLMQVYAQEYKDVHFLSVAPGLIDTDMQKEVYGTDVDKVPNVQDFRDKKDNGQIESSDQIAFKIISLIDVFRDYESGGFVDLREL